MHPRVCIPAIFLALTAACSSNGTTGSSNTGGGQSMTTTTGSGAGGNATSASSGTTGTGGSGGGPAGTAFSYGLNLGYYNSQLSDIESSQLGLAAGASSHRHKLTEPFLDTWGDDIHVAELTAMTQAGEHDLVCFIIGASAAHSNAPAGASDYDREHYSPKNLWEPVFTTSGDVNPNNHWAAFVERLVKTYSPFIHTWEVWNEPDQVGGNWQATEAWNTDPPKPSDLVWWNDTIFAYIRMLRVTHEVVHKLDPQGKVALGGLGYPSFLGAILRYTDEPTMGKVDADHPEKGGAYFDVVSYHYYPVFGTGSSDVGAKGLVDLHDQLQAELNKAGVSGKRYIITESGAPHYAFGSTPGGADYARNYLMKSMALAQNTAVERVDWFILGDSKAEGASTDPFSYMGLYLDLSNVGDPKDAKITETGTAYASMGHLLAGSLSDTAGTAALGLPSGTNGVALRTPSGKHAYVVWAEASDENGTGTVSLPAGGDALVYPWNHSQTNANDTLSPSAGKVEVSVTSSPVIVIAP
ncbi:Hypothetical protein A7982_11665 [Minicystis rosea]|nr:Hypothetical protein A7982_11665 [Minicystis rosea]